MGSSQGTLELQSSTHASHESQSDQQNNHATDIPLPESSSISTSNNDSKKVTRQDIELLYMNRDEVVKILLTRTRIDPGFTALVEEYFVDSAPGPPFSQSDEERT